MLPRLGALGNDLFQRARLGNLFLLVEERSLPMFQTWPPGLAKVLGTAEEPGIFMQAANAIDPVPQCIDYDKECQVGRSWASNHSSGEMSGRQYPALLVTGPEYPRDTILQWVKVQHLSTYNEFSADQLEKEHLGVEDYLQQMKDVRARI